MLTLTLIHLTETANKLFCRLLLENKKYVLSNSESVQCNFFIFEHVTFIQFKICCCVQNFIKIGRLFTEIYTSAFK